MLLTRRKTISNQSINLSIHTSIGAICRQLKITYDIFTDIDECKRGTHNCMEASNCKNTIGSYTCLCNKGYEMKNGRCVGKCIFKRVINFKYQFF